MLAAACALVPLVYLLVRAAEVAPEELGGAVLRGQLLEWTLASVLLTVAVTVTCLVGGVVMAWLLVGTDLPGARWWLVASAMPLAVPSYDAPVDRTVAGLLGEVNLLPPAAAVVIAGGTHAGGMHAGVDDALAVVRPEQIRVVPEGARGVPGEVLRAEFLGAATRTTVRLEDGHEVVAVLAGARPRAGDRVRLALTAPAHLVPR